MIGLSEALAAYLAQQGHGVYYENTPYGVDDIGIVLGLMPSGPDRALVIAGYPSTARQGSSNQPEVIARLQFRIRDRSEPTARHRCYALHDLLDGHRRVELAGGLVLCNSVMQQADPLYQGADDNERHEFATTAEFEYLRPQRLPA